MLNLKSRFGKQFRVTREAGSEKGDPFGLLIACRHGHIYLHGVNRLGVATDTRGPIAKRLAALPGLTIVQDGSDGINCTFAPELFEAVAAVIRPKRRRRLSPEHRAKLVAAGESFRKHGSRDAGESARRNRAAADGQTADIAA
jgi:hypothetical protein